MSLIIKPNQAQALSLKQQLQLLAIPKNKRIRLLKTLGRNVRAKARRNIKEQRTVTGQAFAPRASGKKNKMLKRMGKTLEPYVKNTNRLELKHKSVLAGRVAAMHQNGIDEQMTASRMTRIHGKPDYKGSSTRGQAKALAKEGYKIQRKNGKGYRKATIREIMTNVNQGQAMLVLKKLRGHSRKTRWIIPVKERPFLGDTPQAVQEQIAKFLQS